MGDSFTTVYDAANQGFVNWEFPAVGLIFVAAGLAIFFAPRIIKRLGIPFFEFPSWRATFFRYVFLGFAIFWTVTAFLATYSLYQRHHELAATDTCRTVEGKVEDFVPMPRESHADESFTVSGVAFHYSDYSPNEAFNNTAAHGGPVRAGSDVRICYDPADHAILKLAIRGFKGPFKDFGRGIDLFSAGNDDDRTRNVFATPIEQSIARWQPLAHVWAGLYILDLAGLFFMVLPLLRTFWLVESLALAGVRVPPWLEPGRKTKLRDTLALWDAQHSAIWLRARGFNYFRFPHSVAKLVVDEREQTVSRVEVRFSSVLPLVLVLFMLTAYVMFSATLQPLQAGLFVGVFAIGIAVSAGLQRARLIDRWQILARAALDELAQRGAPAP